MRYVLVFLASLLLTACGDGGAPSVSAPSAPPAKSTLELLFTYGSEKKDWIDGAVQAYNAKQEALPDGRIVHIQAIAMGSGECLDEILQGTRQPHLVSPASAAFITMGNAAAQAATGKALVTSTENLVLSPVVIAMWKPMAERLGWPQKHLGWSDILKLASDPQGWASVGEPVWGRFRFGHTHPEYSNSGLMSLLAEIHAASGKTGALTSEDIHAPAVQGFVSGIEGAVMHYGSSTGFFADRMFNGGMGAFSAAVVYESNIVDAANRNLATPVVAIYPKEGTFWSDHPIGLIEREWVTPAHRDAGKRFIRFLLDRPQQEAALRLGFRPGSPDVAVAAPIDVAHGCDATQPTTTLSVPSAPVLADALAMWRTAKKPAQVTLVLDLSGSMNDEGKIDGAKAAAKTFINALDNRDECSLLVFNSTSTWAARKVSLATSRANLLATVDKLFAGGGTALYDAILEAQKDFATANGDRITALIVLSDGEDTESTAKLADVQASAAGGVEKGGTRIFTIAYGKGAKKDVLKSIAEISRGKVFTGDAASIRSVFRDISTFF
jgi:Ca-activated chloride channel family protein